MNDLLVSIRLNSFLEAQILKRAIDVHWISYFLRPAKCKGTSIEISKLQLSLKLQLSITISYISPSFWWLLSFLLDITWGRAASWFLHTPSKPGPTSGPASTSGGQIRPKSPLAQTWPRLTSLLLRGWSKGVAGSASSSSQRLPGVWRDLPGIQLQFHTRSVMLVHRLSSHQWPCQCAVRGCFSAVCKTWGKGQSMEHPSPGLPLGRK